MNINENLLHFTEHLVSISEFSKGKTSKIFDDVKKNNTEYIVLKNNQPTAMVVSIDMYKDLVEKASKMEILLEKIEENRLLNIAESRMKKFESKAAKSHEDFVREMGFDPADIERNAESVDID